jgi:phenylpyruvate tautomerase PptA (4-oxalocrotonate tautomerase family)
MRVVDTAKKRLDVDRSPDGLSRRAMLITATIAAGAASGAPAVLAAESPSAASFGAPLVEMYFPVGVLSLEQKAALIRSVTDVVNAAMQSPADPARRLFVEIIETPEGGFGVNGQAVGPRAR